MGCSALANWYNNGLIVNWLCAMQYPNLWYQVDKCFNLVCLSAHMITKSWSKPNHYVHTQFNLTERRIPTRRWKWCDCCQFLQCIQQMLLINKKHIQRFEAWEVSNFLCRCFKFYHTASSILSLAFSRLSKIT